MTELEPKDRKTSRAAGRGTSSRPATSGPLTGRKIGPYRVTEQIGKGGMGVVYRAHDMSLDRTVAIKILPGHLSGDEEFVKRFVREARSAARLDHPNIVQVFQAGRMVSEAGGGTGPCFIAMQYFDGRPLSEVISEEGRLEPGRALNIARQVAEALGAAHAAGIVHRDIKSSNVLVGAGDRVKVADFGLATCIASEGRRITQTGSYLGTPEYSSPEQCETIELDGRTDIYSLGVVLYEMLTGKVPFEAATPLKLFERIAHEPPEPISRVQPGLPRELSAMVGKMLAKKREERYSTAEELLSAMRRVRVALGSWKRAPGTGLRRAVRGASPWGRLIAAAAAIAILGLTGYAAYRLSRPGEVKAPSTPVVPEAHADPSGPSYSDPTVPVAPPDAGDLGVVIFDLTSRFDEGDEKRLSWVRAGIPDMLITELRQCPGLAVFSRDRAIEALKAVGGRDHDSAARQLGARLTVSGSLYAVGGKLRIDLCVADTASGKVADAVKDEGTEEQIFELVNSLGRKLRASFDSLVSAHRGGGQPLASVDLKGAEECLFLAMSAPSNRPAVSGGSVPGFGGEVRDADMRRSLDDGQAFDGRGSMPNDRALGGAGSREGAKGAIARGPSELKAHGWDGAQGDKREAVADPGRLEESNAIAEVQRRAEASRGRNQAQSQAASGTKRNDIADNDLLAASPRAAPPAPAAAAPVAKDAVKADEQAETRPVGAWTPHPAAKPAEAAAKAGGAAGGGFTMVVSARSGRIEAMRHYYNGLELLKSARVRRDFSDALAELALAKSAAPEFVAVDEAIQRAGAGLDAATE